MAGRIEKRGEESYRLTAYGGYDDKGKQIVHRKTVKCKSKREAEKMLAEYVTQVDRGQVTKNNKITLKEFIDIWIKDYASKQLAAKTLYRYKEMMNSRIIPCLGHIPLHKIRPSDLLSFYSQLEEDGIRLDGRNGHLSERTILHHHRLIHSILRTAVQWQYLYDNPADRVKAPRVPTKPMAVYGEEEVASLLNAVENEHIKYKAIIMLAISTGMRQGEIMGLEWRHIDFQDNTIDIQQCAQYLPGKGAFIKEPKNPSSRRKIAVPSTVMNVLAQYQKWQEEQRSLLGDQWQESGQVFLKWNGKPMYPNEMSSWFPRFLTRRNLKKIPFHGLRHTSATLLIANGATPTDLSRRLGHSNTSTTLNIYAHSLKRADSILANKMESIMNPKTEQM